MAATTEPKPTTIPEAESRLNLLRKRLAAFVSAKAVAKSPEDAIETVRAHIDQAERELQAARLQEAEAAYLDARIGELELAEQYFEMLAQTATAGRAALEANRVTQNAAKTVGALGEPAPSAEPVCPGATKLAALAFTVGVLPRPEGCISPAWDTAGKVRDELAQLRGKR
jgi:hypothetical protein